MRACPACGASNGPEDDFCGNCGAYLAWSDDPPPAAGPSTTPAAGPAEPELPDPDPDPATNPSGQAPSAPAQPPAAPWNSTAPPCV
ncbi:hypothetical protein [Streptomyces beihaiensis]|uniref:Zinc ribbon domain-containing protein n=1 Tax=Streptomyces beihaiensis TaxID=2984495 RepID=A0ABT3TR86_9ACTN|nr:hypothetical protein [Streptomyces beihaiensis]MCX3059554.1 hypothetical protein [Streptomyces beihaiensis]